MEHMLRVEIETARTELGDAVQRLNRLEEEVAQMRITVKRSFDKILELEQDL
jgi:uncharacterized protein (UPF0335 family)